MNYLEGFSKFVEQDKYVGLVKHQMPVNVKSFMHMPITLPAHYKVNGKMLGQPLTLYVCDSSDAGVTLCNVPNKVVPFEDNDWDADGELDVTPGTNRFPIRLRMSKEEFRRILTPPATGPVNNPMGQI